MNPSGAKGMKYSLRMSELSKEGEKFQRLGIVRELMASDEAQIPESVGEAEDLLEVLIRFFSSQTVLANEILEGRRESPPDFLVWLEGIQTVRRILAANSRTPGHLLQIFSKVEDYETLVALIQNPATPQGVVDQILRKASYELRCMLAGSRGIPLSVMRELANDPGDEVRWVLAENPWVGEEIMEILSRNSIHSVEVILNLLRNPNLPRVALAQVEASGADKTLRKIAKLLLEIDDLKAELIEEMEDDV